MLQSLLAEAPRFGLTPSLTQDMPSGAVLWFRHDDKGGSLHRDLQNHQNHCIHADCPSKPQTRLLQQKIPSRAGDLE